MKFTKEEIERQKVLAVSALPMAWSADPKFTEAMAYHTSQAYADWLFTAEATHEDALDEIVKLRNQVQYLLDMVDYTAGACRPNEMIAAVLDRSVIARARAVLNGEA